MTLRTAGLIAGVIGVILVAVGLIAQAVKPASSATPSAAIDATVVVIPPEVVALSPDAVLTIEGSGDLVAHTARTADVAAWTASRTAVTVTGIGDWETLTTTVAEPQPSATPSPSGSASPSPSESAPTSPSASPSPSPSASPSASPEPVASPTPLGSQDIWRDSAQQAETYTIAAADIPVGLTLVVEALGDTAISEASLEMPRTIDDQWMTQVLWWGIGLSVLGLIALIALFVDVRPAQTKGEEWLAGRAAVGSGKEPARPGSRRARREAGTAMPVATIPAEPTTGSIPIVTAEAPMIAVTGSIPKQNGNGQTAASSFEPPSEQTKDKEDRS